MVAAAVVLVGLTIKHERLSTDGVPGSPPDGALSRQSSPR